MAVFDKGYFEDDLSDFDISPRLLPKLVRWKGRMDFDVKAAAFR